jgi:quinol monooxygenase YgiN
MTVEWRVPPGQARPITLALHSLSSDLRGAPGCLGCAVVTDLTGPGAIRYTEDWASEDDLRARVGSAAFLRLATLLEATAHAPRIQFALASGTRGLEFVEEVRRGSRP